MMPNKEELTLIGAGLGLLLLAGWYAAANAKAVGQAAAGVVGDATAGAVIGVGDWFGIPETNETECERAIREGRTWDASFACPAGTFIRSIFD